MAKSSSKVSDSNFPANGSKVAALMAAVNEKFPQSTMLAKDLTGISQDDIPTGIYELDYYLGGGFARGCSYHLYGESGHGKSATMTKTIAFNQAYDPDFVAAVVNLEGNWGPKYIPFMVENGVDMDRCLIITEPTVEKALDASIALLKSRKLDFLVYDSAAAIMSSGERDKNSEDNARTADRAGMIERLIRKLTAHLHPLPDPKNNTVIPNPCSVVFLNQLRTGGIGNYRAFRQPASSEALKFFVRNQICCYSAPKDDALHYAYIKEIDKLVEPNDQTAHFRAKGKIGKKINYEIEKSRSGDESAECAVDFYFKNLKYPSPSGYMGIGFDTLSSLVSIAAYLNIVENAGAWYKFNKLNFQGIENFMAYLRTEPVFTEILITEVEQNIYGRRLSPSIIEAESDEGAEEKKPEIGESDGKESGNGPGKSVRGRKKA